MPGIYWALKSGQGWKYLKMTSDFLSPPHPTALKISQQSPPL